MSEIVYKVDDELNNTKITMSPFARPALGELMSFEMGVVAEAGDRQFKSCTVKPNLPGWGNFAITCDEGTPLDGDDTAPSPLSYLCAGIAFCMLTHLVVYAKGNKLNISNLKLELKMGYTCSSGGVKPGQDLVGRSDELELYVMFDSEEPEDKTRRMFDQAAAACMALDAIRNPIPVNTNLIVNGKSA